MAKCSLAMMGLIGLMASAAFSADPVVIRVIDQDTGRGIPLVTLTTTNANALITDSAGVVAFDEPGLKGGEVYLSIASPGYSYPKDGFGNAGVKFIAKPGAAVTVKMKREQIAQRLYRITGQGIYHHSTRAGLPAPFKNPNLNGRVMGQDTVMAVAHRGKLYWFYGDTFRPEYPLGNFGTSLATSAPADKIDPAKGIALSYAVDKTGFSRPVFKLGRPGVVWLHGVTVLKDPAGADRIVGHYSRLKGLGELLEHGIAAFNDKTGLFEVVSKFPLDTPLYPYGQTLRHTDGGAEYVYFCTPYAQTRVPATWGAFKDPNRYEAFTAMKAGTRKAALDRLNLQDGKARFAWKVVTARTDPPLLEELVRDGKVGAGDAPHFTRDAKGNQIVFATGSIRYNTFRKRWIMIACRRGAPESFLGEVYYAEAASPHGPWPKAIKVATHPGYTFYNPVHHAFLDRDHGRHIYFEGTYTHQFSKTQKPTPRYDYNQIMYGIDLGDRRIGQAFGD